MRESHGNHRIEMHFKGLLAVEAKALSKLLQEHGQAYNPFHVPIMCVTTRGVPGGTAAKLIDNAVATETPEAARQSGFAAIKGCMRSLELAFEDLPDAAGVRLGMRSESGGALMLLVLNGSPSQVAETGFTVPVQVRIMYRGSAPPEHRERAAIFVSLANFGLPVCSFDFAFEDGNTLLSSDCLLEPGMSPKQMERTVESAVRAAVSIANRYEPGVVAVAAGMAPDEAIGLCEPGAPPLPQDIFKAPAAPLPVSEAETLGQVAAIEALEAIMATGPLTAQKGGKIVKTGEAAQQEVVDGITAGLRALGITSFSCDANHGRGRITFAVGLSETATLAVEIAFAVVVPETGGPSIILRVFDMAHLEAPPSPLTASSEAKLIELIGRLTFSFNYGHYEMVPREGTFPLVSFVGTVLLSSEEVGKPGMIAKAVEVAMDCCISTCRRGMPAVNAIVRAQGQVPPMSDIMRLLE